MSEEEDRIWREQEEQRREAEERAQREGEQVDQREGEQVDQRSGEHVEAAAIVVGTTIVATTTIDAIMTSLFPTRTADLTGTPVYTWAANGPPVLSATWPTATTDQGKCVQLLARFEVHSVLPSIAGP